MLRGVSPWTSLVLSPYSSDFLHFIFSQNSEWLYSFSVFWGFFSDLTLFYSHSSLLIDSSFLNPLPSLRMLRAFPQWCASLTAELNWFGAFHAFSQCFPDSLGVRPSADTLLTFSVSSVLEVASWSLRFVNFHHCLLILRILWLLAISRFSPFWACSKLSLEYLCRLCPRSSVRFSVLILRLASLRVPCMRYDCACNDVQLLREGEDNFFTSPHHKCDRSFLRGFIETSNSTWKTTPWDSYIFSPGLAVCTFVSIKLTPCTNRGTQHYALWPQPPPSLMSEAPFSKARGRITLTYVTPPTTT